MIIQAHLFIKGEVIGVGFRAWTKIQAKQQRINGWVRNVYDKPEVFGNGGGVEVLVQGEQSKVDEMITLFSLYQYFYSPTIKYYSGSVKK